MNCLEELTSGRWRSCCVRKATIPIQKHWASSATKAKTSTLIVIVEHRGPWLPLRRIPSCSRCRHRQSTYAALPPIKPPFSSSEADRLYSRHPAPQKSLYTRQLRPKTFVLPTLLPLPWLWIATLPSWPRLPCLALTLFHDWLEFHGMVAFVVSWLIKVQL